MSELAVYFWDVQHGHAAFVRTPNGRFMVFDLGIGDYSLHDERFSPLLHIRDTFGVERLDYVCVSHPHLDHIDDILNLELLNPRAFRRPSHLTRSEVMANVRQVDRPKFEKYCELNERYSHPISLESDLSLSNPKNWGGVNVKMFTPTTCPRNNFNNHSVVAVLEYLGLKVVIPGDNEVLSFNELMLKDEFKIAVANADVLLAPHHGRDSGYDPDFVSLVNPRITVVSDGRFCDTSANARYSRLSRGWLVHSRSGANSIERQCLTTNSDGHIEVKIGPNGPSGNNYLKLVRE
jgi:beta-lactamase superfamily II metal-dependent hydrolase